MQEPVPQLTIFGIIRVSGEDAFGFLQAQLTCDLAGLSAGESIAGAWCNPKGRIIANLLITRHSHGYILLLDRSLVETVSRRLSMFVLRSRVNIEILSDRYRCHALIGNRWNETELLRLQQANPECVLVHHPRWPADRSLLLLGMDSGLSTPSPDTAAQDDDRQWRLLEIQAGIPWITMATTEQFLPQELGMDASGGISYNKGCFPGQEVIARLHYRGQVKKHLYKGEPDSPVAEDLLPGARLYPQGVTEQACGTILDCIDTGLKQVLLAVVRSDRSPQERLQLDDGTVLSLTLVDSSDTNGQPQSG